MVSASSNGCPVHGEEGDSKSAALAARYLIGDPGATPITGFALARDVLRSRSMRQAGAAANMFKPRNPDHAPVFYLDGEPHRRKRSAIARFFTPKAIEGRYRAVMEQTTERLLKGFRAHGRATLDTLSYDLAVAVAAEIIGLTNSNQTAMGKRISEALFASLSDPGTKSFSPRRALSLLQAGVYFAQFFLLDVRPAIRARRKERQQDVISHLLDEGYSSVSILIECMTYAVAGMVTTREFIVMAAWHLFERDALRERFVAGTADEQIAILEEILRLEPVASMLHRQATDVLQTNSGHVASGELVAINIREANTDEAATGSCPHKLDPDRARRIKESGSFMSFGDGSHRCPGSQVALQETRVFLDGLFKDPNVRLEQKPSMTWRKELMSYELRNAIITCAGSP